MSERRRVFVTFFPGHGEWLSLLLPKPKEEKSELRPEPNQMQQFVDLDDPPTISDLTER